MAVRLPVELYRAEQVREFDRRAIEKHGIPGLTLMQRAARAAFTELRWRWPDAPAVTVVCGTGNNAGDGLLIATLAHETDMTTRVLMAGDADGLRGDARRALDQYCKAGGAVEPFDAAILAEGQVIVDALL